jgi:hypothetical protein
MILQSCSFLLALSWSIAVFFISYGTTWSHQQGTTSDQATASAAITAVVGFLAAWAVLGFLASLLLNVIDALFVCFAMDRDVGQVGAREREGSEGGVSHGFTNSRLCRRLCWSQRSEWTEGAGAPALLGPGNERVVTGVRYGPIFLWASSVFCFRKPVRHMPFDVHTMSCMSCRPSLSRRRTVVLIITIIIIIIIALTLNLTQTPGLPSST